MLRLVGEQVESLFDEALPIGVRELPEDLARLDVLLSDAALLEPIAERWEASARGQGRPTIAMSLFVRLMVVKQRSGWGYETLVREVSDSLHLRRFCGLSLTASVPHESTVRKLARRLGPEVIDEMTRVLIGKALREKRFTARAMRVDSTVVESDVRWPSDAALALDATRRLAREGARVADLVGEGAHHVQDRSRAAGRRLRLIGRTVGRRLGASGGAREQVLKLTGQAGELVRHSIREVRKLVTQARASARGRGAQRKLAAAQRLEQTAELAATVTGQIIKRLAGEKITDRVVSLADPDARPIGKGKLGKRYEFGYVFPGGRDHPEHKARRSWPVAPGSKQNRFTERERAAARDRRRACASWAQTPRSRTGRWLPARGQQRRARRGQSIYRRAITTHGTPTTQATGQLPSRLRGTNQSSEAQLWATPITATKTQGRPHLGWVGDPDLQPRHARRPEHLTNF